MQYLYTGVKTRTEIVLVRICTNFIQDCMLRAYLSLPICWPWTYLMKVTPETSRAYWIVYLRLYLSYLLWHCMYKKRQKNPSAYGASRHFQQYLSYIMAVSCIGGGSHRHAAGHWQTLLHKVVSSISRLSGIWTHNFSSKR